MSSGSTNPCSRSRVSWTNLQNALAGSERIFDFLDGVPDVLDRPGAQPMPAIQGHVRFEDVWAGYEVDRPVLRGVSLEAEPGQTIALVGPTGAGKTTIINLLTRFYEIDEGQITIDGTDIRDIQKADLRRELGLVLQDTFLFADTVMENIRYGRLDATDEECMQAAKLADADHFIRQLPHGYQTLLSERASNLSQGQRQLLSISRAILADPGILILDEATSSVDTRTEARIQKSLLRLMQGRTSFVIAHRLSTIRDADQVVVIDHGEIVERGTHDTLLAAQGRYFALYTSQFVATANAGPDAVASAGVPAAAMLAAAPALAAALAGGGGSPPGYPDAAEWGRSGQRQRAVPRAGGCRDGHERAGARMAPAVASPHLAIDGTGCLGASGGPSARDRRRDQRRLVAFPARRTQSDGGHRAGIGRIRRRRDANGRQSRPHGRGECVGAWNTTNPRTDGGGAGWCCTRAHRDRCSNGHTMVYSVCQTDSTVYGHPDGRCHANGDGAADATTNTHAAHPRSLGCTTSLGGDAARVGRPTSRPSPPRRFLVREGLVEDAVIFGHHQERLRFGLGLQGTDEVHVQLSGQPSFGHR